MANQTTALTLKQKKDNFVQLFEKYSPQIMSAMPKHIAAHLTPERVLQVMRLAMSRNPKLYECPPVTVIGSMIQASQLGLSLDPAMNEAHLMPIWNGKTKQVECELWQGYKAIEKLTRNSGDVVTIEAECVYQKDEYKYILGLNPILEHKPSADPDRGEIVATYAIATMRDGTKRFKFLWKHQTDTVKKAALARTKNTGPWVTDEDEMCKKTAKKRIGKDLPMSAEAQKAIALDDMAEAGVSQGLEALVTDDWSDEGENSLDKLTKKLDPEKEVKAESTQGPEQPAGDASGDKPAQRPHETESKAPEAIPDENGCKIIYEQIKHEGNPKRRQNAFEALVGSAVYDRESDPAGTAPFIEQGKFFDAATQIMKLRGWI